MLNLLAILPFALKAVLFLLLIVVGLVLILFIVKIALVLLPAAVVALIVYLITGDLLLTGIAFLVISAIALLKS